MENCFFLIFIRFGSLFIVIFRSFILYPLKFYPIYKEKEWGGSKISDCFSRQTLKINIGESLEICSIGKDLSIVRSGSLCGKNIKDLISKYGKTLLGDSVYKKFRENFPLIIKFVDVSNNQPIHFHKDNLEGFSDFTFTNSMDEMCYVLYSKKISRINLGLKKDITDKNEIKQAILNDEIPELLDQIIIKEGDSIFIPGGTIHSIEKDCLLADIQSSFDETILFSEFKRKITSDDIKSPNIDTILDNLLKTDFENYLCKPKTEINEKKFKIEVLKRSPFFTVERWTINSLIDFYPYGFSFNIFIIIAGSGEIRCQKQVFNFKMGDVILIPAKLSNFNMYGDFKMLNIYIE